MRSYDVILCFGISLAVSGWFGAKWSVTCVTRFLLLAYRWRAGCRQIVERIGTPLSVSSKDDLGLMHIMPLHEVEPELEQDGHGVRILDALGDRLDVALVGALTILLTASCRRLSVIRVCMSSPSILM